MICLLLHEERSLAWHLAPLVNDLNAISTSRCRLRARNGSTSMTRMSESNFKTTLVMQWYRFDDPFLLAGSILPGLP